MWLFFTIVHHHLFFHFFLLAQGDDDDNGDEWEDVDGEDDDGEACEFETAMDEEHEQPTGDVALDTLRSLIHETGSDRLFPPLDGTALYSTLCKINHSCEPNVLVTYTCTQEYGLVAKLHALRPIMDGEELLQSYVDQSMGKWSSSHHATAPYLIYFAIAFSNDCLQIGRIDEKLSQSMDSLARVQSVKFKHKFRQEVNVPSF